MAEDTMDQDMRWVLAHLDDENPKPPRKSAGTLLKWALESPANKSAIFKNMMTKKAEGQEQQDTGAKMSEDACDILIGRMLDEWAAIDKALDEAGVN